MTIPCERTNAIIYTRKFLQSLLDRKETPRVPLAIRKMALRCLRHYPYELHMEDPKNFEWKESK